MRAFLLPNFYLSIYLTILNAIMLSRLSLSFVPDPSPPRVLYVEYKRALNLPHVPDTFMRFMRLLKRNARAATGNKP